MTAQDREAIWRAMDDYEMTEAQIDAIEAQIEQARDEAVRDTRGRMEAAWAGRVREAGIREVRMALRCDRQSRLVAALLRSRRIDRAALAAVNDTLGSLTGWVGPDTDRLVIVIQERMADAERTAREENHRG